MTPTQMYLDANLGLKETTLLAKTAPLDAQLENGLDVAVFLTTPR